MSLAVTMVVIVLMVAVRSARFTRSHGISCIGLVQPVVSRLFRNGRSWLSSRRGDVEWNGGKLKLISL
jgi:hypothetical protein